MRARYAPRVDDGPKDQTRFVLNVQPVMPFSLGKDWNLIARVIMPFVSQLQLAERMPAACGVSDVLAPASEQALAAGPISCKVINIH